MAYEATSGRRWEEEKELVAASSSPALTGSLPTQRAKAYVMLIVPRLPGRGCFESV